jgi:hemerythrin
MAPQWSPALAVGIAAIDTQHQELFRRAGELVLALKEGRRTDVGALVEYLGEYADRHFDAEEGLMEAAGYPGLARHQGQHAEFRKELARLVGDYERKGATPLVTLTLHNWLSDWLRQHVSTADVEAGAWMVRGRAADEG